MKKYWKYGFVFLLLLALCGGWYLMWNYLEKTVEESQYEAQFATFDADGAHYLRMDKSGLHAYLPDVDYVTAELCGEPLGVQILSVSMGTMTANAYTLKGYEYSGENIPVRVLEISGKYYAYELTGFRSLDNTPEISAVCQAYGINSAEDIVEITETDAASKEVRSITDSAEIKAYYNRLLALGKPLNDAEAAKKYYEAYIAKYGETDDLYLENGSVQAKDDESYQHAMQFWGEGMYTADFSLKNGLKLRGCICAPNVGVFSVYANYEINEENKSDTQ